VDLMQACYVTVSDEKLFLLVVYCNLLFVFVTVCQHCIKYHIAV